jgi:hypothetical protein
LDALSLRIVPTRALAFSEYPSVAIEDRHSVSAFRVLGLRLAPLSSSHFIEGSGNALVQIFRLREEGLDPTAERGQLTISFSAEQFSDSAVGDVWDGTIPSFLARLREPQFASLTTASTNQQYISNQEAIRIPTNPKGSSQLILPHYLVLKDGQKLMGGTMLAARKPIGVISLGDDSDAYLSSIQTDTLKFIRENCSTIDVDGFCTKHFISHDYIEWAVKFVKDAKGIQALELVHDLKFSGTAASYNVVFMRE